MDRILEILNGDNARLLYSSLAFLVALILIVLVYKYIIKKLTIRVGRTNSRLDDFVVEVLRLPFLCLMIWMAVRIFSQTLFYDTRFISPVNHGLRILLIATFGWFIIKFNNILFYYLGKRIEEETENRFELRSSITKFSIFQRLINGLITIVIVAICLMTFDKIRTVGVSLLTSAGIAGIILGFAAQKSISMVVAGIQLAITQPIKLNDLVVIDGESGRIEEIKLTYVVVNLWDKRRLIIPANYFLEQKFENWTRHSSDIVGAVFIYVDYRIPILKLKEQLVTIVQNNSNWDGKTCSLEVNKLKENCIELRALISSENATENARLQSAIREGMLHFIQDKYPEYLTQTRVNMISQAKPAENQTKN